MSIHISENYGSDKLSKITKEAGRSMIEMLGVLAIIGILSVGGLIGFSRAIERHRINETINQVALIAQNTRDLFKSQKDYGSLLRCTKTMSNTAYENRVLADKTLIFPISIRSNGYKNIFEGEIEWCSGDRFAEGDNKAFLISFRMIPKNICIELITRNWNSEQGLIVMRSRGTQDTQSIARTYETDCVTHYTIGDGIFCAKDLPVTVEQAANACDKEVDNWIAWKFY